MLQLMPLLLDTRQAHHLVYARGPTAIIHPYASTAHFPRQSGWLAGVHCRPFTVAYGLRGIMIIII